MSHGLGQHVGPDSEKIPAGDGRTPASPRRKDGPSRRRGPEANLDRLVGGINANRWFTFGKLLLDEGRREGLIEAHRADAQAAKLEASQSAREITPPDPCDASPSVRRYLSQLDGDPPKGTMDINEVRRILKEGLAKQYPEARSEAKRQVVENAIRLIHLIAGDGPFDGDSEKLITSINRFSRHCLMDHPVEPIDTVLATFLALSCCDTSTREDHDRLLSQLRKHSVELQSQVNGMLADRGLDSFFTPQEVQGASKCMSRSSGMTSRTRCGQRSSFPGRERRDEAERQN